MLLSEETYKPRKYSALLPLLAPLVLAFFYNGRDWAQQKAIGWITAGCIVASAIIYLLLRTVSVTVTRKGLLFKTLPGERLLEWKSLQSVYVHRVWSGRSSYLELVFNAGDGERPATLNTKLYSRRSLRGSRRRCWRWRRRRRWMRKCAALPKDVSLGTFADPPSRRVGSKMTILQR